ncbi:hypothetical protein BST61_g2764 [Cercospora zeina]
MQPQDPCYFVIANRTAYDIRYLDKTGSDWPESTKKLVSNFVIKPGMSSGKEIGILVASGWGTSQWGHLYFAIEGHGRYDTLLLYLHSDNPNRTWWKSSILDDHGARPTGRDNVPGRRVGSQASWEGDYARLIFSGGDIMAPLRLDWWMHDLCNMKPEAQDWPIAKFKIPGTHDSCTWGTGATDWSWRCQDYDLYEQMKRGIREFDIRLTSEKVNDYYKFIPHHDFIKNTAPDFCDSPWQLGVNTLAERIMKYADEHPTEIFILRISTENVTGNQDAEMQFGQTIQNFLGRRLARYPADGHTPSYREIMNRNQRNIILYSSFSAFTSSHASVVAIKSSGLDWNVPAMLQVGGDGSYLYNEDVWKSGQPSRVIDSVAAYVRSNSHNIFHNPKIWGAQVQLTPSLDIPWAGGMKEGLQGVADRVTRFFWRIGTCRRDIWRRCRYRR